MFLRYSNHRQYYQTLQDYIRSLYLVFQFFGWNSDDVNKQFKIKWVSGRVGKGGT